MHFMSGKLLLPFPTCFAQRLGLSRVQRSRPRGEPRLPPMPSFSNESSSGLRRGQRIPRHYLFAQTNASGSWLHVTQRTRQPILSPKAISNCGLPPPKVCIKKNKYNMCTKKIPNKQTSSLPSSSPAWQCTTALQNTSLGVQRPDAEEETACTPSPADRRSPILCNF